MAARASTWPAKRRPWPPNPAKTTECSTSGLLRGRRGRGRRRGLAGRLSGSRGPVHDDPERVRGRDRVAEVVEGLLGRHAPADRAVRDRLDDREPTAVDLDPAGLLDHGLELADLGYVRHAPAGR